MVWSKQKKDLCLPETLLSLLLFLGFNFKILAENIFILAGGKKSFFLILATITITSYLWLV
jgi:hypothetical protein